MAGSRARSAARLTVLLVIAAQLADLATFGLAARAEGPGGELGPLGAVYAAGGFAPVAAVKVGGLLAVLCILALYALRVGWPRRLALIAAAVGVFGAATNVLAVSGTPWAEIAFRIRL